MKQFGMIGIGVLLVVIFFGVATANITPEGSRMQRATGTPSPTAVLRTTLQVRPLPLLTPLTITLPVSATPGVTGATAVTATQTLTLPIRTTPTPTLRATPTTTPSAVPAAADATEGIINVSVSATRLRGQIELRWEYDGEAFAGVFTVERSANGGAWRYVASCTQPYVAGERFYRCRDTGLTSGAAYQYRICITDSGYSCADAVVAESGVVRSP